MLFFILLILWYVADSEQSLEISFSLRIVGGSLTTIEEYSSIVAVLQIYSESMPQFCAGIILNEISVLTVAHCVYIAPDPASYGIRVGSSMANKGGIIYGVKSIIVHPNWNPETYDCDIAIMHTNNSITYSKFVQPAIVPDINYVLKNNAIVWAVGWGYHYAPKFRSEQLRHVMIWTIDHATCRKRYENLATITNNMLCSGWLDVGLRDQCIGDSGGPIYHLGIVVGISSFGYKCGNAGYPGINTRLSRFSNWIQANSESRIIIWDKNKTVSTFVFKILY